ncbi:response regulator [Terasakiella sp. SH-1]|uniref:response regulator n=1 Tax=Terasakiella sp. SH-1 TaxID=2560057 RepID=UPI0010748693|nr:response regulator [Terasakiella sp. SH-1]
MKNIFVIDDDEIIRDILQLGLQKAGYNVVTAENGINSAEKCKTHEIDLVISDILMEDKDGLGTLIELRDQLPTIPVLIMSSSTEFLEIANQIGARAVLEKPIIIHKLVDLIDDILSDD